MLSTVVSALNEGFVVTFQLFLVTLVGALPLGLLVSFGSMNKWTIRLGKFRLRPIQLLFRFIVWLFRGSPLLLQLMIIFYIPGELGYQIWSFENGRFWAAAAAFILNYACYFSEIYRGGIEAIPRGQDEAGPAHPPHRAPHVQRDYHPGKRHVSGQHHRSGGGHLGGPPVFEERRPGLAAVLHRRILSGLQRHSDAVLRLAGAEAELLQGLIPTSLRRRISIWQC